MDWIEQWLGWSPDQGDGTVEAIMLAALIIAAVAVFTRAAANMGDSRQGLRRMSARCGLADRWRGGRSATALFGIGTCPGVRDAREQERQKWSSPI